MSEIDLPKVENSILKKNVSSVIILQNFVLDCELCGLPSSIFFFVSIHYTLPLFVN